MSTLLKTERALQRWLLGSAAYLITGEGDYVVTDKGLKLRMASGFEFFLPVVRGQDDIELTAPCVITSCPTGRHYQTGSLTMLVDVEITLRYPADAGDVIKEPLAAFEYAAGQLAAALYRDDLPQRLSEAEELFNCQFAPGPWTEMSGFIQRLRVYTFRRQLVVSPRDL